MIKSTSLTTTGEKILESVNGSSDSLVMLAGFFCNTDQNSVDVVDVYVVPYGGTASDGNIIVKQMNVDPTDTIIFETEKLIIADGDYIFAKSQNGTTTVTISYMGV